MNAKILTKEIIPTIKHWFEDADTQKYLGGTDWLDNSIGRFTEAIGKEFRGAHVIDRIGYVFYRDDEPVGYVEAEVYDCLTTVDKEGEEVVVKSTKDLVTAVIVYIVGPEFRNQGLAKEMLHEFIALDRFKDVKVFMAGTEEDNTANMKLLASIGFHKRNEQPDFEDMINWELKV